MRKRHHPMRNQPNNTFCQRRRIIYLNTNPPSNTQDISLSISDTETYTVTVTDKFGCTNTDDITINIGQMPITNIGTDTTLCFGESYVIDASNSSIDNYLWHDMSTSPTINASISGWYKITLATIAEITTTLFMLQFYHNKKSA